MLPSPVLTPAPPPPDNPLESSAQFGLRRRIFAWLGTFIGVTVPLLGLAAAIVLLWGRGFDWVDLGLLIGMYLSTMIGVTVGFHRLFTHRSFQTTRPIQFILGRAWLDDVPGTAAALGRPPPAAPPAQRQRRRPALAARVTGRGYGDTSAGSGTRTSAGRSHRCPMDWSGMLATCNAARCCGWSALCSHSGPCSGY